MPGPWEKYATQPQAGPWEKYAQPAPPAVPGDDIAAAVADALFPVGAPAAPGQGYSSLGGRVANTGMDLASSAGSGMAKGLAAVLGAPVDLINASPMLANLLPGEQGATPISDYPVGGAEMIGDLFNLPADAIGQPGLDYEPQGMPGRFAQRIGEEAGAVAPIIGWGSRLAAGTRALDEMSAAERWLAAPMRAAPNNAMRQEAAFATASGAGAQTANEVFTPGGEGTMGSDLAGSLAGTFGYMGAGGLAGMLRNLAAGATNNPRWMDDIAGQAVVDQIIDNSSMMHGQAEPFVLRGREPRLDTAPLAAQMRTPADVERLVPGYTADIGTRAQDPKLQTFVQDANARSAGAGNTARTRNTEAVNRTVGGLAPQGDPAQFRLALQQGVDEQIASLFTEEQLAQAAADEARGLVLPQMAGPSARGADIRAGAQDAYTGALDEVGELYRAIEGGSIDPAALAARFGAVDQRLPVEAPRPAAAGGPARVVEQRGEGPVPFAEAQAIRSNLSDEQRAARAGSEPYRASIAGQYRDELDQYLTEALDPEAAAAYQTANRARFDVGQRFEEGNTAIAQALRQTERGGYVLDNSALPRKFVQPDTGRISDYQGLMREAGDDPRVRDAIADQVLEDAQPFLGNPTRLRGFLEDHNVVLSDFPEVRQRLEDAGVKTETLAGATAQRTGAERDLTTPGRSPEADYLYKGRGQPFGNDENRRSVVRVVNSADPRAATRQLLDTAGGSPEAAVDLRAAFWEEIKGRGQNSATDMAGQDVWNARKVRDTLNDPKFAAVAEELWRDDPDDLAAIRDVFTALEAAAPGKARAPGSSGTAQSIQGKLDPSLTTTSLASRGRSVSRHQMSLGIATIDVLSTWLRNKSAKVQARAIDALAAQVVNNPGLAADLLEKFNPADYAARRQMLTQKYGARITQLLTALDAANGTAARAGDEEEPGEAE